jgi:transposase
MESMGSMKPRRRRSFTPEFKAEIVDLCQRGDRSVGQVAKDFDLTETAVREWVKQAGRDAGTISDGGLTTEERTELAQLRREDRRLREDVEILNRATASGHNHPVHRQWRPPGPPTVASARPPSLAARAAQRAGGIFRCKTVPAIGASVPARDSRPLDPTHLPAPSMRRARHRPRRRCVMHSRVRC